MSLSNVTSEHFHINTQFSRIPRNLRNRGFPTLHSQNNIHTCKGRTTPKFNLSRKTKLKFVPKQSWALITESFCREKFFDAICFLSPCLIRIDTHPQTHTNTHTLTPTQHTHTHTHTQISSISFCTQYSLSHSLVHVLSLSFSHKHTHTHTPTHTYTHCSTHTLTNKKMNNMMADKPPTVT